MSRKIRCGVVGVGRMGQHHARVYHQLPECELVGVVDASEDRRESLADRFSCKGFATVQELLAAGVEAVSIAVPTTAHYAAAEPLLTNKVACLIEKPLAENVETARRLRELSEKHNATLMVGHIERFNPIMRAMQRATAAGQPVIPRFIEVSRVSPMSFRSVDVSVIMDMMIHDLDVVLMLMGGEEPDEVEACGVAVVTEHEDICSARLTWKRPTGTCVANITSSRLALKTERVTRITGENAYIKIDYGAKKGTMIRRLANQAQLSEVREQLRKGEDLTNLKWSELVNIEPITIEGDEEGEPIVAEIQAFLEAVTTGTRPPIDADAGFINVRTAQRIIDASRATMGLHGNG